MFLKNRLKYCLVCGVVWIVRRLPILYARRFADFLSWLLNDGIGVRKSVIEENIRRAFPDLDEDDLRTCIDDCYTFFSRAGVDWIKLDEILRTEKIEEEGWEILEALEDDGAIVVSGHFGYWELAAVKVAQRYDDFQAYADRQSNPHSDTFIQCHRDNLGLETVSGLTGIKKLLRNLNDGNFVGVMGDQRANNNFHYVPLFGRAVRTSRIIPFLARRTGKPVVPMSAYRDEETIRFKLYEPLETSLQPMETTQERDLLVEYNQWLESEVLKKPSQYFWLHKRWKDSIPLEEMSEPVESKDAPAGTVQ